MNNTVNIARGGLYTALGVLFIYLSNISPTSKIYILGIASCIIPFSILTTSIKNSFYVYIATSLLSAFLIGPKGSVIAYILLFGLYGFIKYYIERLRKTPLEIILKLVYFNASMALIYTLANALFSNIKVNIPIYAAILMLQFVFLIFDYALTLLIIYIDKHFGKNKLY